MVEKHHPPQAPKADRRANDRSVDGDIQQVIQAAVARIVAEWHADLIPGRKRSPNR